MDSREIEELAGEWNEMMEVWQASPIGLGIATGGMRDGLFMLLWLEMWKVRKALEDLAVVDE